MLSRRDARSDVGVLVSDAMPSLLLLCDSLPLEFVSRIDLWDEAAVVALSNLKLAVLAIKCSIVDAVVSSDVLRAGLLLRKVSLITSNDMRLLSLSKLVIGFLVRGSLMCRLCELFSIEEVDEVDDEDSDDNISSFSSRLLSTPDDDSDEKVFVDRSSLVLTLVSVRMLLFLMRDVDVKLAVDMVDDDDDDDDDDVDEEVSSLDWLFSKLVASQFMSLLFFRVVLLLVSAVQSTHSISGELWAFRMRLGRFFLNHSWLSASSTVSRCLNEFTRNIYTYNRNMIFTYGALN